MSDPAPNPAPPVEPDPEPQPQFSEFEQAFLDTIERRYSVSEGTDAPAASTTEPELEPEVDPGEEPDEGPGSSPETEEGAPPDEGEAPSPEDGQSSDVFTLSGVEYTPTQLAQAVEVHNWFAQLDPNQVHAIDALMSGQYRLAPAQEAAPSTTPTAAVSSGQAPSSPSPSEDEGEWLDPRAQEEISNLKSQIQELQSSVNQSLTPVLQRQYDTDYQVRLDAISRASDEFQGKYSLADEQMRALEATVVESQMLPNLADRYGSLSNGMQAALEMFFWTTPDYRDAYLKEQQASAAVQATQDDAATVRKQQLTALSASGGSAPRREPVPATPEDRHEAMRQEIAAAMNGSSTV